MAIQFLRGNASTLNSSQQVFLPGQPIFEQDTGKLKIGNGSDVYSALSYIGESGSGSSSSWNVVGNPNLDNTPAYIQLSSNCRLYLGNTQIVTAGSDWRVLSGDLYITRTDLFPMNNVQLPDSDIYKYIIDGYFYSTSSNAAIWNTTKMVYVEDGSNTKMSVTLMADSSHSSLWVGYRLLISSDPIS